MDSSKNSVPKYAQTLFHDLAKLCEKGYLVRNAQNTVIFVFVPIFAQGKAIGLLTEFGRRFLGICLPSKNFI